MAGGLYYCYRNIPQLFSLNGVYGWHRANIVVILEIEWIHVIYFWVHGLPRPHSLHFCDAHGSAGNRKSEIEYRN